MPAAPVLDAHETVTDESAITVSGSVEVGSAVRVSGPNGTFDVQTQEGRFEVDVPLAPLGANRISEVVFTAISDCGGISSATGTILTQDTQPPSVFIDFPADGSELGTPTTDVTGRIGDLLSGFMGLTVFVNGAPAPVDPGVGTNGTFFARDVQLLEGSPTEIRVIAADSIGNELTKSIYVTRVTPIPGQPSITMVSGNGQTAGVGELLAERIVVRVSNGDGSPRANARVTFTVTRSDGRLSSDAGLPPEKLTLDVVTDAQGEAGAFWQLGIDSGSGNNQLEAKAQGVSGTVFFCASGVPAPASQINIASGNSQRAEPGATLPQLINVWVHDGRNEAANVPVTFTVVEGGGKVDGQDSVTVNTDNTGHIDVAFTLGPNAGNHLVEARLANPAVTPAVFNAVAVARDETKPTRFAGLVLDNAQRPIQGATVVLVIGAVTLETVATLNGEFRFDSIPSFGVAELFVNGLTATHVGGSDGENVEQGSFPALHYDVIILPNADNALPAPVLLPSLNPANARVYDGTQDVELTIEGVEGLKMTVRAGSMRHLGGDRPSPSEPAILSLNQVDFDSIPMPMPDGASPPFAWTLQPPGATFDPPVEIEFPNLAALSPGATMYFLSFNHDTNRFEIVATGHVTPDGSTMVTDAGSGLLTSGWGGFCPPYPNTGSVEGDATDNSSPEGDEGASGDAEASNGENDGQTTDTPNETETGEGSDDGEGADGEGGEEGDRDSTGADFGKSDPVVLRTGELIITETDLRIPGRGFSFEMQRTYRSQYNRNGPLGHNWDFTYNEALLLPNSGDEDQSILRCGGRSRIDRYVANPDGSFTSPDGFYDELHRNTDGTFTIRDEHGFKTNFDDLGRLKSLVDRNGNRMTFDYDPEGHLSVVTDTLGREISFTFNAKGRVASITDFMGREVRYRYDENGDLVSVTSPVVLGTSTGNDFPDGKTTRYEYASGFATTPAQLSFLNHNLVAVIDPKEQRYLVNTYGTDPDTYQFDRVISQQFGRPDQVIAYGYTRLNAGVSTEDARLDPTLPRNQTVEVDRNGNRRTYVHNEIGNLLEDRVETNRNVNADDPPEFITRHTYNVDGERLTTTHPEGNQTTYTFDDANPDRLQQGNLLAITRLPGPRGGEQSQIRTTRRYEPIYNQLLAETEARGNDPNFVPQNGGSTSPARYTITYTFDYQEGNSLAALATELRRTQSDVSALLAAAAMSINLGDVNGDGLTNQLRGNVVRRQDPTVHLLADLAQAAIEGDTTQEITTTYTYNRFGQVTSEADPEGNVDDYLYHPERDPDGDGIPTFSPRSLATDTGGYRSAVVRDNRTHPRRRSAAPLTQIRNEWLYDPVGNVVRTIDGRGNPTSYEVNALNQVVRETLEPPFNYEHAYIYDANDNVIREEIQNVDTNGPGLDAFSTHTYEYDILDNVTRKSVEVSVQESLVTRYEYDRNENQVRIIQPVGNVMARVFDERDLIFSLTRGAGSADASTRTFTYDGNRNLVRTVDAADNNGDGDPEDFLIEYDGYDRRVETRDAVGNEMTYAHDPAGNVINEQHLGLNGGASPSNNEGTGNVLLSQERVSYDELGREYEQHTALFANTTDVGQDGPLTPGDGNVTSRFEFDRNDRRTRTLDDNEHQQTLEYDGADRAVREEDHLGNVAVSVYDKNGNVVEVVETELSPEGHVPAETFTARREYDTIDRISAVVDNLGNRTEYRYDSRNNLVRVQDNLRNVTRHTYDGINRRLSDTTELRVGGRGTGDVDTGEPGNPDGLIEKLYSWDPNSRLESLTDDNDNVTTYRYDALDRKTADTFADGTENTYVYDGDDNIVEFTDENGSIHANGYDGINRLVAKDVTRAAGIEGATSWRFEYDGLSRKTKATDNNDPATASDDSVVQLHYDSLSRVLVEIQNGKRVESTFDGLGNRLANVYPNGRTVVASYDELDRIKTIGDEGGPSFIAEYDYLGPTRVIERRFGNSTRLRYHDGANHDVGYDGNRRAVRHRHERVTGQLIASFGYVYDREDNRRFELDQIANTAELYEYDSRYRLTRDTSRVGAGLISGITNNETTNADVEGLVGLTETTYRLDGVGNWLDRTRDGTVRANAVNEMNEYASIGGAAQEHDDNGNLTADGTRAYFYDFDNRLVRVAGPGGDDIARYAYDALGRRIRKTLDSVSTSYFYSIAQSIEERDGSDATVRQYVFGSGLDEVVQLRAGSITYFYHDNSLGSVVALSDSGGTVAERYQYSAYGETTVFTPDGTAVRTESFVSNPFRFTGQWYDSETALYHYRARYYDPTRGRYVQRDPMGYADAMGLYEYVGNNPINFVDPLGLEKNKRGEEGIKHKSWLDWWLYESVVPGPYGQPMSEWGPQGPTEWGNVLKYTEAAGGGWKVAERIAIGTATAATAVAVTASLAQVAALQKLGRVTQAELKAISKIKNILSKNLKPGPKGDIAGAMRDMVGNPVTKPRGGTYDHVQDLGNILRGLRRHADTLKNATSRGATSARSRAQRAVQQIEEAIKGTGI